MKSKLLKKLEEMRDKYLKHGDDYSTGAYIALDDAIDVVIEHAVADEPHIIDGKDMTELFVEAVSFLRDASRLCRERGGEDDFGAPSVVYDNVCDAFELALEHGQQMARRIRELEQEMPGVPA